MLADCHPAPLMCLELQRGRHRLLAP
jgi:hypothetical protein